MSTEVPSVAAAAESPLQVSPSCLVTSVAGLMICSLFYSSGSLQGLFPPPSCQSLSASQVLPGNQYLLDIISSINKAFLPVFYHSFWLSIDIF